MTSDDCGCPTCAKYRPASGQPSEPHPTGCGCLGCVYDPTGPIPFPRRDPGAILAASPDLPPVIVTPGAALDMIERDVSALRADVDTIAGQLAAILDAVKKSRR